MRKKFILVLIHIRRFNSANCFAYQRQKSRSSRKRRHQSPYKSNEQEAVLDSIEDRALTMPDNFTLEQHQEAAD
jgi:hypothetical protein